MSGDGRCAGLERQPSGSDDDLYEIIGGKSGDGELGRNGECGRIRQHDVAGKMHHRANRAVVVGRAGDVTIAVRQDLAGGLIDDAYGRRAEQILGMDVRERERQLQQQREEPEARAELPSGSPCAHIRHAGQGVRGSGLSISRQRGGWATLPHTAAATQLTAR
jgi:hypothetical protein